MSGDRPGELVTEPSPHEMRDPETRRELKRASVWLGLAAAMALVVILIQPILIIMAGLVFASMLDGGVRLLGRVLKIGRGWRLMIVVVLTVLFVGLTVYKTGSGIVVQFHQLQSTLTVQFDRLSQWAAAQGIAPGTDDLKGLTQQALGSVGKLTSWIGTAIGAISTMFIIMVIGVFVAMEPRIYDRGLQWIVPTEYRAEFALTLGRMASQLRRLLAGRLAGMAVEGVLMWIALSLAGIPMALVLGIITGMLAFIPNIGAFVSGVLMISVGFSAGVDKGLAAIFIYFVVQAFDGWVVIPYVARRTVDLPPALTLSMQILASTLFGVLGLALADPLTAMIKVAMERTSERAMEEEPQGALL
ncbi:AI-2E family transporter [Sphingomonas sp.]|jgi:predicted PurR-regulated permease PerM|uniref:AI-2E family transporter n=1 Tax=Sphingomonas sp. TaxID=28214 RepID=UPI002E344777|nr:AI-2E family transporter [Sphingomonas sp.]HEX4694250.1 AI-2E family transporter [Sphingomonas sp.]